MTAPVSVNALGESWNAEPARSRWLADHDLGNAVMESFFRSLKQELTHHERFKDRDVARSHIIEYIESFYNRQQLHSSLGYHSPEAFERMAEVTN